MSVLARLANRIGTGAEVALGAAMAAAIVLTALAHGKDDRSWLFGIAVGIALCVTALMRGRQRARAALTGLFLIAATGLAVTLGSMPPVGPFFGGGIIGLAVLGAAAARTLPARPAVIIAAAGTVVIAVSETAGPSGLFDHRALFALAGATVWSAGLGVGVYLRYLDFLHRQTLQAVRRGERLELARELHDAVAHHVTGIVVQAQAARFAGAGDPQRLLGALDCIETAGNQTLAAVRQMVGLLRDPDDAPGVAPGHEPISQLVERFARHGPAVDLRLPAGPAASGWPPEVASTVYRVVQEALTNIARHAPAARSVTVSVTDDPGNVGVEITDDAPAGAARATGGYGLVGMRERVEALGGKLRAGPLPGAGWAVQASLPVAAPGRP
jgi:signal transduction histidine kinase